MNLVHTSIPATREHTKQSTIVLDTCERLSALSKGVSPMARG